MREPPCRTGRADGQCAREQRDGQADGVRRHSPRFRTLSRARGSVTSGRGGPGGGQAKGLPAGDSSRRATSPSANVPRAASSSSVTHMAASAQHRTDTAHSTVWTLHCTAPVPYSPAAYGQMGLRTHYLIAPAATYSQGSLKRQHPIAQHPMATAPYGHSPTCPSAPQESRGRGWAQLPLNSLVTVLGHG